MRYDQDYFQKDTRNEVENLDKWLYDNKKKLGGLVLGSSNIRKLKTQTKTTKWRKTPRR